MSKNRMMVLLVFLGLFLVANVFSGCSCGDDDDDDDSGDDDDTGDDDDNDAGDDDDDTGDDDDDNDDTTDGFVLIENGTFVMGSPESELGRDDGELQHQVTLTRDFEIMSTEVTQSLFESLTGWEPSYEAACGPTCPVETVTWYDALAFADLFSDDQGYVPCFLFENVQCYDGTPMGTDTLACMNDTQGGIGSADVTLNAKASVYDCEGFRLPTEAEWEYAVRAGTTTAFYSGDITTTDCDLDPSLDPIGWYCGNDLGQISPAAQKLPNAWGLFDGSGNVNEWVWDNYLMYSGDVIDPEGADTPTNKQTRGGSWQDKAKDCRSASRLDWNPGGRSDNLGFRLVRTAP